MNDYHTLSDDESQEDVVIGGKYTGIVYNTTHEYILVALHQLNSNVDATEMAGASKHEDLDDAVTVMVHQSDMGVLDPNQFTVGDQIGVYIHEVLDGKLRGQYCEALDATRNQVEEEVGPGWQKTPTWDMEEDDEPEEEKVYVCEYCGREFDSGGALGGHMKVHSDEREAEAAAEEEPEEEEPEAPSPTTDSQSLQEVFADGGTATVDDYTDLGEMDELMDSELPKPWDHNVPQYIIRENADIIAYTLANEMTNTTVANVLLEHASVYNATEVAGELIYDDVPLEKVREFLLAFEDNGDQ